MRRFLTPALLAVVVGSLPLAPTARGQVPDSASRARQRADSLYIAEVEERKGPDKVLHAEPLFIDLIRDLGARKGEAEWNVGMGLTDRLGFDEYRFLVEYEWAPIDRLGLELEVPVTTFSALPGTQGIPRNRVEGLKAAVQRTTHVSTRTQTSLAFGYLHEFLAAVPGQGSDPGRSAGFLSNPFVVGAKRWGDNAHSLIYAGTRLKRTDGRFAPPLHEANVSLHWMISGTRNFVGLESNIELERGQFDAALRPQMRLGIADNLLVGIAAGIPLKRERERLGFFLRLIYEPGARHP